MVQFYYIRIFPSWTSSKISEEILGRPQWGVRELWFKAHTLLGVTRWVTCVTHRRLLLQKSAFRGGQVYVVTVSISGATAPLRSRVPTSPLRFHQDRAAERGSTTTFLVGQDQMKRTQKAGLPEAGWGRLCGWSPWTGHGGSGTGFRLAVRTERRTEGKTETRGHRGRARSARRTRHWLGTEPLRVAS